MTFSRVETSCIYTSLYYNADYAADSWPVTTYRSQESAAALEAIIDGDDVVYALTCTHTETY